MKARNFFKIFVVTILILFATINCRKKDNEIPSVAVNIDLDLNSVDFSVLNTVGNYVYVTGGAFGNGIVVYRRSIEEFKAYDRTCTYKPQQGCRVKVDGIFATDSCCGSQFLITDGSINKKPATIPLKEYSTVLNGTILHIYH